MIFSILAAVTYAAAVAWHFALSRGLRIPVGHAYVRVATSAFTVLVSFASAVEFVLKAQDGSLLHVIEVASVCWMLLAAAVFSTCLIMGAGRALQIRVSLDDGEI